MTPVRASYRFSNPARKKTRPIGPRRLAENIFAVVNICGYV